MAPKKNPVKNTQPKEIQKAPKKDLIKDKKVDTDPIEFSNDPSHFDLINKKIRALKKKLRKITDAEKSLEAGKKINADQSALISNKPQLVQNLIEIEEIKKSLTKLDLSSELQLILGVFHYSNRSESLAKFAQLLSTDSLASSVNYGKNLLYGNKEEPIPGTSYADLRTIVTSFIATPSEQNQESNVVVEEVAKEAPVEVQPEAQPEVKAEVQDVKHEVKAEVQPEVTPQAEQDESKSEVKVEGEPAKDVAENQGEQKQEDKNFKNRNNRRGNRRGGRDGNRGNRDGNREGGNRDGNREGGNRDGNRGNRDGGNRDGGNRDGGNRDGGNREGNRGSGNRNRDNREGGNRDGNRGDGNRGNRNNNNNQGNRNNNQGNRPAFKKPQNDGQGAAQPAQ